MTGLKSALDNELKLKSIFNSSLVGIFIINENGQIEKVNQTILDNFELKKEDIYGKRFSEMIDENDRGFFDIFLSECLEGKSKTDHFEQKEIQVRNQKGQVFNADIEFIESRLKNERFFLGIIRDISKRLELRKEIKKEKHLREQINEKLEKEKELGEMKTRFVSIASHEFRTPLAGILSSVQLLKRYLNTEEKHLINPNSLQKMESHFGKIEESVINLTQILDDFLSLNKLEDKEVKVNARKLNLERFLAKACDDLETLCKDGQRIKYIHKGEVKTIKVDSHILRSILNNLVSNAIKYSGKGDVIKVLSKIDDGSFSIEVQDNGIGIPEKDKKELFRRFFRATNASEIQGTGLGLNIVKRYTDLMDGKVSFHSEENKGSIFKIECPIE